MSETLKHTTTLNKISGLVTELTNLWLEWMKNHNISNNTSNSLALRRAGGEKCETLQRRRQEILVELNESFNSII